MAGDTQSFFGIDLGTTYSVVAYVDEFGRPAVVRDQSCGSDTTPSVVYFEKAGGVVVGETAKNVARLYPDRVVQRVKRHMGQERFWEFDGQTYTPESISALILKQLAQNAAQETGGPVKDVVVTVPAYFGMLERDATRQAGRIAGLNVIGIVPEPVAAALQYEVADATQDRIVLVYDLGGGTFDTTVIRVCPDAIQVLCTDGDQELGGVDWDDVLIEHVLDEFTRSAKPDGDPRDDNEFMQELRDKIEDLKRQLSAMTSRNVPLRYAGAAAMIEVTRDAFERATRHLLDKTLSYTDRTMERLAGRLGVPDPVRHIDDVLLVGGSSKMPAVAAALTEKYGWHPRLHDPDLAVAKGAARFALSRAVWAWDGTEPGAPSVEERRVRVAALAERTGVDAAALERIAAKQITTVLPKAFGVRLVDTTRPGWQDDIDGASYIEHLVHASDELPVLQHLNAATVVDNQPEVKVEIYEQAGSEESREMTANKPIDHDEGKITGLPPLPANSPIDVVMTVDPEGHLTVKAVEPASGKDLTIEVRISVLSEADVVRATSAVREIAVRS
ncbi:MAG TPA: Hsp70 family protein [Micromonosporaceae bacterium]|nr:Hsp70 family protein [Micromonosporaceae bacterium]